MEAPIDEVTDSITAAVSRQLVTVQPLSSGGGGAAQRMANREDQRDWRVVSTDPVSGKVWLKYRRSWGMPHDVIVRVYERPDGSSLVRAWSRSRMRFLNYPQNRRILVTLTSTLESYWNHHGLTARPSLGDMQP